MKVSSVKSINLSRFSLKTAINSSPIEDKKIFIDGKKPLRVDASCALSFLGVCKYQDDLKFHQIASAKPVYEPCCSYDNVDIFSKQFVKKLETQLLNPTIEDVNRLILSLSNRTQAPLDLIMEILYRLTQFSSYDSLSDIEKIMNKEEIGFVPYTGFLSINAVFNYLENRKFAFACCKDARKTFFIDNLLLEMLEASEKGDFYYTDESEYVKNNLNSLSAKACILDGFDVKASNGRYYSSGFASGSGYLESLAFDVIKRVQKGENLDEVLNGDLIRRFKEIFPDFCGKFLIFKKNKPDKITPETILKNLKAKNISEDKVKKYLSEVPLSINLRSGFKTYQKAVMKYLDNFCSVYSPASFELLSKQAYRRIQKVAEKSDKESLFYIPDEYKSYGLIGYMFAKANNIPFSKIAIGNKIFKDDCQIFVVDDVSISGESIKSCYDDLNQMLLINELEDVKSYFVPLISVKPKESFDDDINVIDNVVVKNPNVIIDGEFFDGILCDFKKNIFSYDEIEMLKRHLQRGFLGCASAIVFPYIIPDNSPLIVAKIFDSFLHNSTITSNKALSSAIGIINNKNYETSSSEKKFLLIKKAILED